MPIDEKDQWTARRLKLAFAVADNYVAACALVAAFLLGYTLRGGQ